MKKVLILFVVVTALLLSFNGIFAGGTNSSDNTTRNIHVFQGGVFLIRYDLFWNQASDGFYDIDLTWMNHDNNADENFTFLYTNAYFYGGGSHDNRYSGEAIDNTVFLTSTPSGENTEYSLEVRNLTGDNRDGDFYVDIYFGAYGDGGVYHIATNNNMIVSGFTEINTEEPCFIVAEDSIEFPVNPPISIDVTIPPILINGDAQFDNLHGVTSGSGTSIDPYIIENLVIDASNANGIDIRNTTAYFIIRNCLIENGGSVNSGIFLDNAINGEIIGNTCNHNDFGIYLAEGADNDNVENNSCYWNGGVAILLNSMCVGNNIIANTLENNDIGIDLLYTCSYNLIESNNVSYNTYAFFATDSENNIISLNRFISNVVQASDDGSNYWDAGDPTRGNYWSDWQPNGSTRWDNNSDGVVDESYSIAGGQNVDYYPLVIPNSPPDQPTTLLCENLPSTAIIHTTHPTFSFVYSDADLDNMIAVWIQVGTTPDLPFGGDTINDMWEALILENVASGGTATVIYGQDTNGGAIVTGPYDLAENTPYYWRVSAMDNNNGWSYWSSWETLPDNSYYLLETDNFEIVPTVNHAPTCAITYPLTSYTRVTWHSIHFTCTASDPDNDTLTYLWDFGDNVTSTSQNPTHAYSRVGAYSVTLTVSDGSLTGSDTIRLNITRPTGGPGPTPNPTPTTPSKSSEWGIPLWAILAIAAGISYWRKIKIYKHQLAFILVGLLIVLYIFAPSAAAHNVITFAGSPPWGA